MTENKNLKLPTVAWEFTAIVKTDKKEFEHKAGKLGKNPPEVPEKMSDEIRDKEPLIRRKDAEEYYERRKGNRTDWEYGFDCGQQELMQKIIEIIEEMKKEDLEYLNTNDFWNGALEKLKQKLED